MPTETSPSADGPIVVDESAIFTPAEEQTLKVVGRSKIWRVIRDALALERERAFRREIDPSSPNYPFLLSQRDGELRTINRLLHMGPRLVVFYDRYVQGERAKGQEPVVAPSTPAPGEPPDL